MISQSFPPLFPLPPSASTASPILLGNLSAAVVLTAVDQGGSQGQTEGQRQKPWSVPSEVTYPLVMTNIVFCPRKNQHL